MQEYLEVASPVQPVVQRLDGIPLLENYQMSGNLCTNSTLRQPFDSGSNNNTDGGIYNGIDRGSYWQFYSPVFISDVDYKLGHNFQYILSYPPYLNTTSLVDNPSQASSVSPFLDRGVRMFGLGDDFGLAINQDADRTYVEPFRETPITGLTNDSTTISSSTPWRDAGTWTRYDRSQMVTTTANTVKFGAYVRCDPNDALRALNMGGLYLWQDASPSSTGARTIYVNAMVAKRAAHTPSLRSGSFAPGVGHYHWSGLNGNDPSQTQNIYRWNDHLTVEGIDYYDAEDLGNWTRIEKTVTLQGSGTRTLGIAMFFAENMSYLNDSGELTGSIDFFNPYVIPA